MCTYARNVYKMDKVQSFKLYSFFTGTGLLMWFVALDPSFRKKANLVFVYDCSINEFVYIALFRGLSFKNLYNPIQ